MKYLKADARIPYMGLNNKICSKPAYWCKLHEVWLSEEDVKKRNCLNCEYRENKERGEAELVKNH